MLCMPIITISGTCAADVIMYDIYVRLTMAVDKIYTIDLENQKIKTEICITILYGVIIYSRI